MTFQSARRRRLAQVGRPVVLRRQTGINPVAYLDVTVQAFAQHYQPEPIQAETKQGLELLAITNDEIAAAAWPGPPRSSDLVVLDGATWSVEGVDPIYERQTCIGYVLTIRGGL